MAIVPSSSKSAHQWECVELVFFAEESYTNPFRQVVMQAEFYAPDGRSLLIPGFWDGETRWKIRFAADTPGTWRWRTLCSAISDTGLHNRTGEVHITPWSPEELATNANRRGFIHVHPSGRYFNYADHTPFYWLGDTFWAGHWNNCTLDHDFPFYIHDRQQKGFTVIQIVVGRPIGSTEQPATGSYWKANVEGGDGDFVNEGGAPYHHRYDVINPTYFQYFDQRLMSLLDAGLVPCLFGGWGQDLKRVGVENYLEFWRYLVARYAAYNVLWSLAGEYFFTPDEEGWRRIGQAVRSADPYKHPITLHSTAPHSGSRHFQTDTWYDFNLIQVGHAYSLRQFVKILPFLDYQANPVKPSIMSESWYENHATTLGEDKLRFTDRDIRFVSYVPLLQGCIGQTYGAHGVWSWASEVDEADTHYNAPATWQHDISLPGSTQMKHVRAVMESLRWWELEPHPELVSAPGPAGVYCAAIPGHEYVVYIEGWQKMVAVFLPPTGKSLDDHGFIGRWFNPRTGDWSPAEAQISRYGNWLRWNTQVPDEEDWILVVNRG